MRSGSDMTPVATIKRSHSKLMLVSLVALLLTMGSLIVGFLFPRKDLDHLPVGEKLGAFESPDRHYVLTTYVCAGDLSDFAVRAAVSSPGNWLSCPKNIYWEYHSRNATVKWLDQKTVQINDKILNVERDHYDFRYP